MGLRRSSYRDGPRDRHSDRRHDDRDRGDRYRGGGDRYDRYNDYDRYDRDRRDDRDRYRDDYRDREWRDRRSPPPRGSGGGGSARYSPKRRSYSRSPARGASGTAVGGGQAISPRPSGYDAPANTHEPGAPRW